jgi:peptidoglycan/xylan/chitin deacetylase (PgdA/CDA1 family)
VQRIQRNATDIEKYFTLDKTGRIIVKADVQDAAGNFEVIYDLEDAEVLGQSAYSVRFYAKEKESDTTLTDTLVWLPHTGSAGILLSFDDDYTETWERYLDLFDTYGAKATFFIKGRFNPFCVTAMNRGHDVGYHSLNHRDLRQIPRTAFASETIEAAEAFRQEGIPVLSFAYPYGFSEPWMHDILFRSFAVLRGYGVTFRIYADKAIRSNFISSRAIDNTLFPADENFYRTINSMLRTVKFLGEGWVLPLTTHDISGAAWGITPRRLEFLLTAAKDLGLQFYRFSDFAEK